MICFNTFPFISVCLGLSVEEPVGQAQVQGRVYINKVFHVSANKMFEMLFTDSSFIRRFMDVRKITSKICNLLPFPKLISPPLQADLTCHVWPLCFSDASFNPWQKDPSGNRKRSLNYTITISNPLIGKFSTATENQVCLHQLHHVPVWITARCLFSPPFIFQTMYKESREGQYYHVESEVYTHDVPYHDYFYTQNQYYITRSSKRKCRLR